MEIIIGLLVVAGVAWFFFMRDDKKSDEVAPSAPNNVTAPYKVPEPAVTTPIPMVVEAPSEDTTASIATPAKKAPAKPKTAAKPKAVAKAPSKAKSPAKPKVTIAK